MTTEEEWYRKFLDGTFPVKGWKDRVEKVLEDVSPSSEEKIRTSLMQLGEKIGREWAKDNNIRKIDNPILKKWGEELSLATKRGTDILEVKIRDIEGQVNKILES